MAKKKKRLYKDSENESSSFKNTGLGSNSYHSGSAGISDRIYSDQRCSLPKPSLFAWEYNTDNVSMMPAIINTIVMTFVTLLFAVPVGVFSAIYLVEYAKRGNKLVKLVRMTTETLSGIPSIVYGLFGYLMFGVAFHWGYSMLSGALTLAIMVLPSIMRTTEEALKAVPDSYREGSFGLGSRTT